METGKSPPEDLEHELGQLRERAAFHELVLSHISDTILITDRHGRFVYVCPNVHHIFGYSPEEVWDLECVDRLLGPQVLQYLTVRPGEETANVKTEAEDRNKELHHLLVTIKHVPLNGGTVLFACRDVTDHQRTGAILEKSREELQLTNEQLRSEIAERRQAEKALRESEDRHRQLVETMNEGLAVVGSDGALEYVNTRFAQMVGYTREEIIGQPAWKFSQAMHEGLLREKLLHRSQGMSETYESSLLSREGANIPVIVAAVPQMDRTGSFQGSLGVFTDITAIKRSQSEVRRRVEELTALNDLAAQVTASLEAEHVLECLNDQILPVIKADLAVVYLLEGDKLRLKAPAGRDARSEPSPVEEKNVGECLCGLVARDGIPIYCVDIHQDSRCTLNECKEAGVTSFAALPLIVENEILGVLGVAAFEPHDFSPRREFLETLASQIAIGLKNAALYEQVRSHAGELQARLSELRRSQEALRISEQRFRAIFEAAQDLIFVKDASLTYTDVNPAMARLFGTDAREIMGKTAQDLFEPEAAARIRSGDVRVLAGETLEEEHTRSIRDQSFTFHDIRVPLRDTRGSIIGICGISRDITERRRVAPGESIQGAEYPSPAMKDALRQAGYAASYSSTVLLQGESGAGKDWLAQWIHTNSERCAGPFFTINCAAVNKELAESELFGHEPGAFSGARGRKRGLLEMAEGGTLLLNEIGELPLSLQSKLLTFLDTKSFLRVGGEKSIYIDARIIAASHRDLEAEVQAGRFLRPLFYRLNVFRIWVPSLRERKEDMPMLIQQIIAKLATELQLADIPALEGNFFAGLERYDWPGNVRELRNVLERALIVPGAFSWDAVGDAPGFPQANQDTEVTLRQGRTLGEVLDEVTGRLCREALSQCDGNKKRAAELLGVSRRSLYRYLEQVEE